MSAACVLASLYSASQRERCTFCSMPLIQHMQVETLQKRSDDLEKENALLRTMLADAKAASRAMACKLGVMDERRSLGSSVAAAPGPASRASAAASPRHS